MNGHRRDGVDRKLIALLEENARISATDLARSLGLARSTINQRITRLENEGVIIGYSAIIRMDATEKPTQAFLELVCDRTLSRAICAALRNLPEVKNCYTVSGQYDLVCYAETPSSEDLDALIEEIVRIQGVKSVDAMLVLSTKFCRGADRGEAPRSTTEDRCVKALPVRVLRVPARS